MTSRSAAAEARHALLDTDAIGFDIRTDVERIESKLGIRTVNVVDLAVALQDEDHRRTVGAKGAVTRLLGKTLRKSKNTTTSDWANSACLRRYSLILPSLIMFSTFPSTRDASDIGLPATTKYLPSFRR